jgi:hypothetical protein
MHRWSVHRRFSTPGIAGVVTALVALICVRVLYADSLIYKDGSGNIQITPYPVGTEFKNLPWTEAQEAAFTLRKNSVLNYCAATYGTSYGGNTWFENEKRVYPRAMTTYLWAIANNDSGKINAARDFLEGFDEGPNTGYTQNVDYYASFTLKGQVPKYFYFGKYGRSASITPDNYLRLVSPTTNSVPTKSSLDRMLSGAKIWLNSGDPLVAAHPEISNPTHNGNFDPSATGVRVDPRGTDNLKAMRDVAAYLFAREAFLNEGNPTLAATYAGVRDLYANWESPEIVKPRFFETPYDFSNADNHALYKSIGSTPAAAITGAVVSGANVRISANATDTGDRGPISLGWKVGLLSILSGTRAAPGYLFEQDFAMDGAVTWNERVATSTDYDGRVTRMEFHANGILVGQDTDPTDGWGSNWTGAATGTHILTARAVDNDGEATWSAPFNVVLPPESTPYDTWGNGPFANAFTNRDPSVDSDGDGLVNLLEFVLGGDPTRNDAPSVMPFVLNSAGDDLVITFKRSDESQLAPQPVTVKVQVSDDPRTWNPANDIPINGTNGSGPNGTSYTVSGNIDGPDTITVTIPKGASARKFARAWSSAETL